MTVLRILRNFGHVLNNIYIHIHFDAFKHYKYDASNNCEFDKIESYLARYCAESLRYLSLCGKKAKLLLRDVHQPLTNVTHLKIFLVGQQHLDILKCIWKDRLPQLKHLFIHNASICYGYSKPVHFDNMETFTMDNNVVGMMQIFPFFFKRLKLLEFVCGIHINRDFCEFVRYMKHLTSIKIWCVTEEKPGCFRKMLESPDLVSTLEQILIRVYHNMLPGDILNFLERSHKLKTFTIICEKSYDLDDDGTLRKMESIWKALTSSLDFTWRCYVIDYRKPYNFHVIERISPPCITLDFQLVQISDI